MKDSNCVYVNIIEKLYLMSSREGEKKEEKRLSPSCWFVSKEKKKKTEKRWTADVHACPEYDDFYWSKRVNQDRTCVLTWQRPFNKG